MNDRVRNILSLILSSIGGILLVLPFVLYWFIHDSYERYIWIINGPFPFSYFGSGPFQMGMYGELFLVGALLLIAAFGIWKQKKLVSVLAFVGIAIFIALGITSLSSFMYLYSVKNITPAPTLDSAEFASKIQSFVIENIGRPIEGFSAPVYLQAFPGLLEADFDGVETFEGTYVYSNGKLEFTRKQTRYISSAGEAISEKGHQTLFNNVRGRLGNNLSVNELIKGITAQGIGRVSGTILLGPTCPVLRDPPDPECADKPIFDEFIVQNAMGSVEFTRFSTAADGNFSVPLPAGEYYITWAESKGPGIQGYLVNVRAGETSEYTITFDTGIR